MGGLGAREVFKFYFKFQIIIIIGYYKRTSKKKYCFYEGKKMFKEYGIFFDFHGIPLCEKET